MTNQFRIDFTITRRQDGEDDFTEIGFGSGGGSTVGGALYDVQSIVENQEWETTGDMPDPSEIGGGR